MKLAALGKLGALAFRPCDGLILGPWRFAIQSPMTPKRRPNGPSPVDDADAARRPNSSGPPSPPEPANHPSIVGPSRNRTSIAAKIAAGGGFGAFEGGALIAAVLWSLTATRSMSRACRSRRGARSRVRPLADRGLRNGGEAARRPENDAQDAARTARERAPVRALRLCPARGRGASGIRDADDGGDGEGLGDGRRGSCQRAGASHDRPWRAGRQLAHLARRAAPGVAPPSSRPTLTGSASPKPRRRCGPRARASSSSPISARGSRRGGRCRGGRIYVLNGLESGADPRLCRASARPAIGGEEELERWSAFAARRDGRVPARSISTPA